jgi:hypothetical protein
LAYNVRKVCKGLKVKEKTIKYFGQIIVIQCKQVCKGLKVKEKTIKYFGQIIVISMLAFSEAWVKGNDQKVGHIIRVLHAR